MISYEYTCPNCRVTIKATSENQMDRALRIHLDKHVEEFRGKANE